MRRLIFVLLLTGAGWADAQEIPRSDSPTSGVSDIHYTPGNPRTVLGGLAFRF